VATFERFEEMHAWQSVRDLVKPVYGVTKQPEFNKDFALRDQIHYSLELPDDLDLSDI
jgi:hypothetical protein